MTKWEYLKLIAENGRVTYCSHHYDDILIIPEWDVDAMGVLGAQGWELTSTVHSNSAFVTHWFKRPVEPVRYTLLDERAKIMKELDHD